MNPISFLTHSAPPGYGGTLLPTTASPPHSLRHSLTSPQSPPLVAISIKTTKTYIAVGIATTVVFSIVVMITVLLCHPTSNPTTLTAVENQYVVQWNTSSVRVRAALHDVYELAQGTGDDFEVLHEYSHLSHSGRVSMAVRMSHSMHTMLYQSEGVVAIEPDWHVRVSSAQAPQLNTHRTSTAQCITQSNPKWGLVRSNIQGSYNPNYHKSFMYAEGQGGSGVDAYIIDTGIYCDHQDFASKPEGSCVHGVDYVDGSHVDINGHGTHVAGVVAGAMYGVAKEANVISVRVLDGDGSGSLSSVMAGLNWVAAHHSSKQSGQGISWSVVNLSLGTPYSSTLNSVTGALASVDGIIVVVAAGNENANACNYSPSSCVAENVLTVGASTPFDQRASYSNFGACVDIFAPGSYITSAGTSSSTATRTMSGTSMAAPHVTGAVAMLLSSGMSDNSRDNSSDSGSAAGATTTKSTKSMVLQMSTIDVLSKINGQTSDWQYVNGEAIDISESPNLVVFANSCGSGTV